MRRFRFPALALAGALVGCASARADILNLTNGDRYIGSIQLVNQNEVHLKSDVVGMLKIPRAKVESIYFGTNQPSAHAASHAAEAKTAGSAPESAASRLALDSKAVEQVQQQFLATATPEANAMFSDMVQGLASGKLSIEGLRAQARDALKELRELQADSGEEEDNPLLAGYVGILEKFINQGSASTNRAKAPALKIAPPPKSLLDDEKE